MPQAAIVTISRVLLDDDRGDMPDEHVEGFWPSHDPEAAGFVEPANFDDEQAKAEQRMRDFNDGEWRFVGVIARATIKIPYGADFIVSTLDSPGLWGVESDSGDDYLNEAFGDERATLLEMLESLRGFTVSEG